MSATLHYVYDPLCGWCYGAEPLVWAAALWQFAFSSYWMVAANLNPLLEFDGYYVVSDWLDRPNLRPRAMAWLGHELLPAVQADQVAGAHAHVDHLFHAARLDDHARPGLLPLGQHPDLLGPDDEAHAVA